MKKILLITIGLSIVLLGDFSRSGGVVTDDITRLQWQDDYSDNSGSIKYTNWREAIDYCEALPGGWRLPNKMELLSIVDYSKYNPAINAVFTKTTSGSFWSSTTFKYRYSAWKVAFLYGEPSYLHKGNGNYVCCVRAGQ